MQAPTRRDLLRRSTAPAHEALDALIGPFNSRAGYECYVRGLYAFRAPLESLIADLAGDIVGGLWCPCSIAAELEQDLADLDLPRPQLDLPRPPSSRDEAIGFLYVLEGSALGARVLVKRVGALGLNAAWGAQHLYKQAEAASQWRAFAAALEAPELNADEMAHGAESAFLLAHNAMSRSLAYA